jgi:uncharacterized protein (TIGR00369 family)
MQPPTTVYAMRLSVEEVSRLVDEHFPQVHEGPGKIVLEQLADGHARVRLEADPAMLRPGGTVSGPTMFKLADFTIYTALLGHLGDYALQAVTTSMSMNFLSRPAPADMIAEAKLLKVGRRLAISNVEIYAEGRPDMVAHATGTYALPPASANAVK